MKRLATSPAADASLSAQMEDQNRLAFEHGKAAFEVNYPFICPSAKQDAPEIFKEIGWRPYPEVERGRPAKAPVDGINWGVGASTTHPTEAFEAATCLRDAQNQREAAVKGGLPPTLSRLYDAARDRCARRENRAARERLVAGLVARGPDLAPARRLSAAPGQQRPHSRRRRRPASHLRLIRARQACALMRQGLLAGRYPAVAAMVVFALIPYLVLSAALRPIAPIIAQQLHMSEHAMNLTEGLANAGYALGTVLSVQLAQHLPQRRMLIVYATALVIGSVLAAAATGPGLFIAGHVLQGLCTSLLLIAAVPPLIIGYPASKLRPTAVIMNMSIFGAVALGPAVGGLQAEAHAWRPLFWVIAGIAVAALVLSLLTFEDAPPADRSAPRDPFAVGLAAAGCVAAFYGASELLTHRFLDASTFVPLVGGLALIGTLLVHQYRAKRPLLIVRPLASTLPVAGIAVAICTAAAAVSAIALTGAVLQDRFSPLHLGLLYLPEFGGAVITAVVFAAVFRTRLLHYFALTGLIFLGAGIVVIGDVIPPTGTRTLIGSGLIGVGVGASVAPALFIAGFSLRNAALQRVFAIIELMRAVAAFMVAPILLHVAVTVGHTPAAGTRSALWICFGLSAGGALLAILLYVFGGVRPPPPVMERWFGGEQPAWDSPPLLAAIRRGSTKRRGAVVRTDP